MLIVNDFKDNVSPAMINTKTSMYCTVAIAALAFSFAAVFEGLIGLAIFCSFIAGSIAVIFCFYIMRGWANLPFIFCVFALCYGLAGPAAVHWGSGLHHIFPVPYKTGYYLVNYNASVFAIILGLMVNSRALIWRNRMQLITIDLSAALKVGAVLLLLGVSMEAINHLRSGGWSVMLEGKASYGGAVADLSLTLPSAAIINASVGVIGLCVGIAKKNTTRLFKHASLVVLLIAILASLYLAKAAVIGQRGPILLCVLSYLVGYCWYQHHPSLNVKMLLLGLLFYVSFSLLGVVRSHLPNAIQSGDWSDVSARLSDKHLLFDALVPGKGEFGASFGNFNTFIVQSKDDPQMGATYLRGLTAIIPRFIWPDKPITATYEFRNTYFPEEAARGAIAGTAYSSILEAYVNFRIIGVVFIYLLFMTMLVSMEKHIRNKLTISRFVFYLSFISFSVRIHRSSFENPFFYPIILSLLFALVYSGFVGARRNDYCNAEPVKPNRLF
jgi:hypothetical protein